MAKKKYTDSATMYSVIDGLKGRFKDAKSGLSNIERFYNKDFLSEKEKRKVVIEGVKIITALDNLEDIMYK